MQQIIYDDMQKAGEGQRARNYLLPELALILDSDRVRQEVIAIRQPMRATEGRMIRVLTGTATYRINLEDYELSPCQVLAIPADSIIEILQCSDDFSVEALVLRDLSGIAEDVWRPLLTSEPLHIVLCERDWQSMNRYMELLATLLGSGYSPAAGYLLLSKFCFLKGISKVDMPRQSVHKTSRGEEIFHRFLRLANEYGFQERSVTFYADRLSLTPNHLSAIVRQQSGQTVLKWLTERTLTEACILLRHSSLMMYEISDRLHFSEATAFGSYFKKHTGMTPMEYRERKV